MKPNHNFSTNNLQRLVLEQMSDNIELGRDYRRAATWALEYIASLESQIKKASPPRQRKGRV